MANADPKQVVKVLSEYYSTSELKSMCFDIGIDYEDLGGQGKAGKARELVQFAQRRGRLDDIVDYVRKTRSHVNLAGGGTTPATDSNTDDSTKEATPTIVYNVQGNLIQGDSVGGDSIDGDKNVTNKTTNINQQGQTVNGPQINTAGDANVGQVGDTINTGGGDSVAGDKNIHEGDTVKGDKMSGNKATGNTYSNTGTMVGSVMGDGSVTAKNIAGGDINIGAEPKTKEEFNQQLQELKTLLEQAIANGEIPASEAEAAQEDVNGAIKEAAKEQPSTRRLTGKLEYVQEVLDKASGVAKAAGKVGAVVLKAAPVLGGLIKVASVLF